MRSRPSCRPISGSLNGASYAAVWSIFSTRVHALTQPPNQPTTFVDGAKLNNQTYISKLSHKKLSILTRKTGSA